MELIQSELSMASITAATSSKDTPVYNATTVPITSPKETNLGNGHKRSVSMASNGAGQGQVDNLELRAFKNMPARQPVDIQFRDITYSVNAGFRKGKKEILHGISGKFPGGQIIAIMGPSGAGKSTLLDVLSGYKENNVQGAVLLNGRMRNINEFRKMSCYITQDDRIQPLLTVLENMRISADFKLGPGVSLHEKETRIEDILTVLGLYDHQLTMSGRLSGGQKKRLSIALELINNPSIMFLDEPTTGLDSFSCSQVLMLLKQLAHQGRTIICTIHQPSAKLFQEFDQVYVLAAGECLYQGSTDKLVPFLQHVNLPCPIYHNPADFIIELACGEFGQDKIALMVNEMANGECLEYFSDPSVVLKPEVLRQKFPIQAKTKDSDSLHAASMAYQIKILLKRGIIKGKRDTTLTYLRIGVNILIALMLGCLFISAGNEASRVLDNYNLLFSILMHHMMTTMMLTILTFPTEMSIVLKETFNRWYSVKAYYASVQILDTPLSTFCCLLFTIIIYFMSSQPMEWFRFGMFFTISMLVVLVAQTIGFIIGAWFNVVNGVFVGPTMSVPMMMFSGFGVTLRDLPVYLKWGSYISHLRYGLEGYVSSIYGFDRETLDCHAADYCHYRYPQKFLSEISMNGEMFWTDVYALLLLFFFLRICCYYALKLKILAVR